jgi:hypothetical protein
MVPKRKKRHILWARLHRETAKRRTHRRITKTKKRNNEKNSNNGSVIETLLKQIKISF